MSSLKSIFLCSENSGEEKILMLKKKTYEQDDTRKIWNFPPEEYSLGWREKRLNTEETGSTSVADQ